MSSIQRVSLSRGVTLDSPQVASVTASLNGVQGAREEKLKPRPSAMLKTQSGKSAFADAPAMKLFNAAASLKMQASQVSMHLPEYWRVRLFKMLDTLYSPEEWDDNDQTITSASFWTFLRLTLAVGPGGKPGIGASDSGNFIAAWKHGENRLTLEFLPEDKIKWSVAVSREGERYYAAGRSSLAWLMGDLEAYTPKLWFTEAP